MAPARTVHPYDLRLESPFRIAYDTVTHARNVLLVVQGEQGPGFGEGAPVPTITGEDQEMVLGDLVGAPRTTAGLCALDMAWWDVQARTREVPLCTALTGAAPKRVPTSITVPLVEDSEVEALVERRKAQGFSIFKVKTGLNKDDDLRRLRQVRDAIGDFELRIDCNQGWSLADAKAALPALADLQVSALEQPLHKEDLAGHAELRVASADIGGPPVMLDESVFTTVDARRALDAQAADWINIKLQKSGGLTEALRIADLCREQDVPCMLGCMLESRIGILHGAHLAAAHDNIRKVDLDGAFLLASDPVHGGGFYENGWIVLDASPGIGVAQVDIEVEA